MTLKQLEKRVLELESQIKNIYKVIGDIPNISKTVVEQNEYLQNLNMIQYLKSNSGRS